MRKRLALSLAYKLNAYINAAGLQHFKFVRRVKQMGRRLLADSRGLDSLVLVEADGQPMYTPSDTIVDNDYGAKAWEPYTTELFKDALEPGATVLDIGAHVGYYTLISARLVGQRGTVYAFEPMPGNFAILTRNVTMNGHKNIVLARKAVADKNGKVRFLLSGVSGMHSLYPHRFAGPSRGTVVVDAISIDRFLPGKRVDVIKMDIEGAEPLALKGMRETIANSPNLTLSCEFGPEYLQEAGFEAEEFLAELLGLGFEVQLIDEYTRSLMPVEKGRLLETHAAATLPGHLYCVKRGR